MHNNSVQGRIYSAMSTVFKTLKVKERKNWRFILWFILTRGNIHAHTLDLKKRHKDMLACPIVRSKARFPFYQSIVSVRISQGDSLRNLTACYLTEINTFQQGLQFRNSMPTHCIWELTETRPELPKHNTTSVQREIKEYRYFPRSNNNKFHYLILPKIS